VGPALFLGYIKGVPFLWTALHCWPQWLIATAALLVIFFVADTIARSRGPRRGNARHSLSLLRKMEFRRTSRTPAHSRFCPKRRSRTVNAHGCDGFIFFHSATRVFEANEFGWRPLIEVAWIFLGIFGTMIP